MASSREIACSRPSTATVTGPSKGSARRIVTRPPGTRRSPREVAQEVGVGVRHAADRGVLARLERVQGAQALRLHSQPSVGDRIPVRVVGGVAELLVDARLELFGEDVLEPVSLRVHGVDRDAERLREVLLEESMVPDDLERDLGPCLGEQDAVVRRVLGQAKRCELLQHRRHRRGRDSHAARDRARRRARSLGLELVDLLQVVLDRGREMRFRHVSILVGGRCPDGRRGRLASLATSAYSPWT